MYKAAYEIKGENVYKPSDRRELGRSIDKKYCPKMTREKVILFQFQGVMKHADHNTN